MAKIDITTSADHPDPSVLNFLAYIRQGCIAIVALVSAVLLCAWLSPAVGNLLPPGWDLMKANTALCTLLCAGSLALFNPKFPFRIALLSRFLAVLVILCACVLLFEYGTGRVVGIDTMLAADTLSAQPGRMSPHSAVSFLLLGVILLGLGARKQLFSDVVDALTLCLVFIILVYISGLCFDAIHLFGMSTQNRVSPQTLLCLFLLTLAVFNDRIRSGRFSVIVGGGIAGKTARVALPFTLVLPFVIAIFRSLAVRSSILQPDYATAFACSGSAMLLFSLVLLLSLRISALERDIRALSLRDELTGLYNRRGFYVLADHKLQLAHNAREGFSVLFLDVDNLKLINDTLGHETGSESLREFASILTGTIRATDVIGRVGGDEFVIAGNAAAAEIELMMNRIEEATLLVNGRLGRSYKVSYSLGRATSKPGVSESLDDLLNRADKIMYQAKRDKRASRADFVVRSWGSPDALTL